MSVWLHVSYAVIALASSGCSFDTTGVAFDGGVLSDASRLRADASSIDALVLGDGPIVDAGCNVFGVTPSNFDECGLPGSNGELVVGGVWRLNLDARTIEDSVGPPQPILAKEVEQIGGPSLIVLVFDSVVLSPNSNLIISGSHPVAIVSLASITIDNGALYIQATLNQSGPGGGLDLFCVAGQGEAGTTTAGVGGGGGGGGFGAVAGTGAPGENTGAADAIAGVTEGNAVLVPLRGGCRGGAGGNLGGVGGGAGGGIQLVAMDTITITGFVVARGGGGLGAIGAQGGGGGGGSGGGILIEAPEVVVSGIVSANGGGGGEGSYGGGGFAGNDGSNGAVVSSAPAAGGAAGGAGGDGGDGGAGLVAARPGWVGTIGATPGAGGGGGGGGVGRIHINALSIDTVGAIITPAWQ